jgi:hypothetical protein
VDEEQRSISPGWVGGRFDGNRRPASTPAFLAPGLMIVRDFNFVGIAMLPMKTDAKSLVDANFIAYKQPHRHQIDWILTPFDGNRRLILFSLLQVAAPRAIDRKVG